MFPAAGARTFLSLQLTGPGIPISPKTPRSHTFRSVGPQYERKMSTPRSKDIPVLANVYPQCGQEEPVSPFAHRVLRKTGSSERQPVADKDPNFDATALPVVVCVIDILWGAPRIKCVSRNRPHECKCNCFSGV